MENNRGFIILPPMEGSRDHSPHQRRKGETMARIKMIDDDDDFRKMLCFVLKEAGYEVVEAPNGKKGTDVYNSEQIDLVVTDIFMPEKEGVETVIELVETYPDIKIIAISGGGTQHSIEYLDQIKHFGVKKTFEKPFEMTEFLASIEELIHSV